MTGSPSASFGAFTFRKRQSSAELACGDAPVWPGAGKVVCRQVEPYCVALRTPSQSSGSSGGRHRRPPTGAAAYGMPRQERIPSSLTPLTLPCSVSMTSAESASSSPGAVQAAILARARTTAVDKARARAQVAQASGTPPEDVIWIGNGLGSTEARGKPEE